MVFSFYLILFNDIKYYNFIFTVSISLFSLPLRTVKNITIPSIFSTNARMLSLIELIIEHESHAYHSVIHIGSMDTRTICHNLLGISFIESRSNRTFI